MSALSPETISQLEVLRTQEASYLPNESICEDMGKIAVWMFVAPAGMGKSTLMQAITRQDSTIGIAGTFTSREPRDDDLGKEYDYIAHSDVGLTPYLELIRQRQVVQYAIHPHTQRLYGSMPHHYPKPTMMLDMLSSSIPGMLRVPFAEHRIFSLVAEPNDWLNWFSQRLPEGDPNRLKRRDEAVDSLTWSLDQPEGNISWVQNTAGQIMPTAQRIIEIGRKQQLSEDHARELGAACLSAAKRIQ